MQTEVRTDQGRNRLGIRAEDAKAVDAKQESAQRAESIAIGKAEAWAEELVREWEGLI